MNLLSMNLLLACCALTTGLLLGLTLSDIHRKQLLAAEAKKTHAKVKKSKKKPPALTKKQQAVVYTRHALRAYAAFPYSLLISGFLVGLALAFTATYLIRRAFPNDQLPSLLWLMIFPTSIALTYVAQSVRHGWRRSALAVAGLVVAAVFGAALANHYYGYYPTVASLFGKASAAETIVLHANPAAPALGMSSITEDSYEPAQNQPAQGKLYSFTIPGTKSHFATRPAFAYLPPAALAKPAPELPVLILLAGSPGGPSDWVNGGQMQATLDAFAARHKGLAPIVVSVDHNGSHFADTECVDSPQGNAETYLTQDVPAYIKSVFNVSPLPQEWAIGGLSDGGMCSLMLALTHPGTFKTFLDYGGESGPELDSGKKETIQMLFGGSEAAWLAHDPASLLSLHNYSDLGGWFGVGDRDSARVVADEKTMYQLALQAKVSATIELVPGGQHTFYVWRQSLQDSLPWLANRMNLTTCEAHCKQN